jgi:hypothetical protein
MMQILLHGVGASLRSLICIPHIVYIMVMYRQIYFCHLDTGYKCGGMCYMCVTRPPHMIYILVMYRIYERANTASSLYVVV